VDADEAAFVERDAGLAESNSGGARDPADRGQEVAALDDLLPRGGSHRHCDIVSGAARTLVGAAP